MLLKKIADIKGPLLTEEKYGHEFTIREILEYYYSSNDMTNYKELAEKYIQCHGSSNKTVQDLREKNNDIMFGDLDKHPSYGMVSISRTSCHPSVPAYGSKIKHNTLISLKVMRSEKNRDLYSEHFFSKKTIVELYFTPSQFAQMVSSINTSGVPCTLRFIEGEGWLEDTPTNDVKREMIDDIDRQMVKLKSVIAKLSNEASDLLEKKGNLKKDDKNNISSLLTRIYNEINSNFDFLNRCQKEKLEDTVAEAQAQVEATINKTISDYGMNGIKEKMISSSKIHDTLEISNEE